MTLGNDEKKLLALVAAAGGVAGLGYIYYRHKSIEEARAKTTVHLAPVYDEKTKTMVIPTHGGGV